MCPPRQDRSGRQCPTEPLKPRLMPVFSDPSHRGPRLWVVANCALGWRAIKCVLAGLALCLLAVAGYFAAIGAWLVVPFAGIELLILAAGFYASAVAGHRRELIEVSPAELRVLRGGRRIDEIARLPRGSARVRLQRDPRGWYPSRLELIAPGRRVEIARVLTEPERERLHTELEALLAGGAGPRGATGPWLMTPTPAPDAGMTWPALDAPAPAVLSAWGG